MQYAPAALALLTLSFGLSATDAPDTGKAVLVSFEYALSDKDHGIHDMTAFDQRWTQALQTCDEHKGFLSHYEEERSDDEAAPNKTVTSYATCRVADDVAAPTEGRKHVTMAFTYGVHANLSMGSVHAVGDRATAYAAARDKVRETCSAARYPVVSMDLSHKKNALGGETVEGSFACIRDE